MVLCPFTFEFCKSLKNIYSIYYLPISTPQPFVVATMRINLQHRKIYLQLFFRHNRHEIINNRREENDCMHFFTMFCIKVKFTGK